jgi:hypothetical protein
MGPCRFYATPGADLFGDGTQRLAYHVIDRRTSEAIATHATRGEADYDAQRLNAVNETQQTREQFQLNL